MFIFAKLSPVLINKIKATFTALCFCFSAAELGGAGIQASPGDSGTQVREGDPPLCRLLLVPLCPREHCSLHGHSQSMAPDGFSWAQPKHGARRLLMGTEIKRGLIHKYKLIGTQTELYPSNHP